MQKRLSLLSIAFGFALLIYMITFEGEPGAVPLAMIGLGSVWYLVVRSRSHAAH